jgi:outer membrane lipoprotein SlyB
MSPDVIARYRDLDQARKALTALERHGIEGSRISLEGQAPSRAAAEHDTLDRDRRVTRQVGRRVALSGLAGAVLGGLAGYLLGGVAFGSTAAVWAAAIGGVIAGAAVGGVMAGYATPAMSEEWELTHEYEPDGEVAVRVTSNDPRELDKAAEVLRAKDPISVERPG